MKIQLSSLFIFLAASLCWTQTAYSITDSLEATDGYSIRFLYGTQTLVSGSTESLYNDLLELQNDKLSPLSSTNFVDPKSSFGAAVTIYGAGTKNTYAIFRFERHEYQRESTFRMKTADTMGNTGSALSSINTQHRLYPLMIGGGFYLSTKKTSLRFEMDAIFALTSIHETMSVQGFHASSAEINGDGFGGRVTVSLNIPIVRQFQLLVDANYTYLYIGYSAKEKNYSGERTFSYYGFGALAGVEFFIF